MGKASLCKHFCWLFGENEGKTANNNSFYFWQHAVIHYDDEVDKYFVLEKNKKNESFVDTLPQKEKAFIIWKDSKEHIRIFDEADLYLVTLSFHDVTPSDREEIRNPCIYLQHGTLGMKKVGYKGDSYNNLMFRFVYYNPYIRNVLLKENDFRSYQLFYGEYHPRYKELIKRAKAVKDQSKGQIFWFITWREYEKEYHNEILNKTILKVITDERLINYLRETDTTLKICSHSLYKDFSFQYDSDLIKIVRGNQIDIMDEIAYSKLLITDYSSLGFDFTFLKKPVILFQPDLDAYLDTREMYCNYEELTNVNVESTNDLIDMICREEYQINDFFASRLPEVIDYDYVLQGAHIGRMYRIFRSKLRNKITFIGYKFTGAGGTVTATKSLAEALLEKGYMVECLSLRRDNEEPRLPYGLIMHEILDNREQPSMFEQRRRKHYSAKKNFSYLEYDIPIREHMHPHIGHDLAEKLAHLKSRTLISTRETLHLFAYDAKSDFIINKLYFFHTNANTIKDVFPGMIEKISAVYLPTVLFVTDSNRQAYEKEFGYTNYDQLLVLGNALERADVRNINRLCAPVENTPDSHGKIRGCYLLRISSDREKDLMNLIDFGKYLQKNDIRDIVIDVYGTGDYVGSFIDMIVENDLTVWIRYQGKTANGPYQIRRHDVVVDFSLENSFGMPYIEGVLNGKMVYCMRNTGSLEVMSDIPEAYIESWEDLVDKLHHVKEIPLEKLQDNYRKIESKYSRNVLAKKLIPYLK